MISYEELLTDINIGYKSMTKLIELNKNNYVLYWAIYYNHLSVVKYLIELGADIHLNNDEALRGASRFGYLEIVKYLVEKGADIHADDDNALIQASSNGHLNIVKYLVKVGANIHADNDEALFCAVYYGHLELVKFLVKYGADIHANNDDILKEAIERMDNSSVINGIYEHSTNPHLNGEDAFFNASKNNYLNIINYLIDHGAVYEKYYLLKFSNQIFLIKI